MNFSELVDREGVERRRANRAAWASSRIAHDGLADGYGVRIAALRDAPRPLAA